MTERERLIDMLAHVGNMRIMRHGLEECADYMIANGVVIVDPEKYPPVTNRGIIDTIMGVPLDEMAELVKAKQEGRLIAPPCKVGDTVYIIYNRDMLDIAPSVCSVVDDEIYEMGYGRTLSGELKWLFLVMESGEDFYDDDVGKTVFLTREEAEKALAERSET